MRRNFDLLAEAFLREGVDTVFTLMGDANMHWSTRIAEMGCSMTYVRHEHAAVAAALAFARLTGKVGVASVTCGPGLTNTLTALPAAAIARIPLVVFAGEPALKAAWYNQMIEQAPFVTASGAAYHRMHDPSRFVQTVRDAFVQARLERRPVVLGVPMDLQDLEAEKDVAWPRPAQELLQDGFAAPPRAGAVAELAELIDASKRVVVLGGLGARDAVDPARQLAERCDGLLATTLPARGLFNGDPFSVGIAGGLSSQVATEVLAEADLVLVFGASLAHHTSMGGKVWPRARVVQIDIDPLIINQGRAVADSFIRADAGLTIAASLARLSPRQPVWRSAELAKDWRMPRLSRKRLARM
jgi:thiamine pyrophosphate-dependent acetolactate synthase large subunit-like protein